MATVQKSQQALPGVEMAPGHFQEGGTPGQYTVRRLVVFGGSYAGKGENAFYWMFPALPDSLVYGLGSGRRTIDLMTTALGPIE